MFLTELDLRDIGESDGKTVYRLLAPLSYGCHNGAVITAPEGFQTDLASVPRLPIIFSLWGDRAHREAVLHDYLYCMDSEPVLERSEADGLFKQAMMSRGQPWRIYYFMWLGVRAGGWQYFHKRKVNDLIIGEIHESV